jgi:hypothetical protein
MFNASGMIEIISILTQKGIEWFVYCSRIEFPSLAERAKVSSISRRLSAPSEL